METIKRSKINPYNEVYGVLKYLGPEFYRRIPKNMLKNIESQMSYEIIEGKKKYYIPTYEFDENFNINNISKDAVAMIYIIYYNYFCDSQEEKQYLKNIIVENERNAEKLKKEKYMNYTLDANNNSYDNYFNGTQNINNQSTNMKSVNNESKIISTKNSANIENNINSNKFYNYPTMNINNGHNNLINNNKNINSNKNENYNNIMITPNNTINTNNNQMNKGNNISGNNKDITQNNKTATMNQNMALQKVEKKSWIKKFFEKVRKLFTKKHN